MRQYLGGLSGCAIYPRDLVKRAMQLDCAGIAISHNHPSGDPWPSREDIAITKKIVAIFESMGVHVYDHIIIGRGDYYSFREKGDIESMIQLPQMSDYTSFDISMISDLEETEPEF